MGDNLAQGVAKTIYHHLGPPKLLQLQRMSVINLNG